MTKLYTKPGNAVAAGYAEFNVCPHLAVDIPNEVFTITAKTSEGRRITFSFLPYKNGGAPRCVDIQYHDGGTSHFKNGADIPDFDAILIGATKGKDIIQHDTRKEPFRTSIVCVLMDKEAA